jgi:hypothetical protein
MFSTISKPQGSTAERYYRAATEGRNPSRYLVCVKGSRSPYGAVYVPHNYVKAWRKAAHKAERYRRYDLPRGGMEEARRDYLRMFIGFFNQKDAANKKGKYRGFNIAAMREIRLANESIKPFAFNAS